MSKKSNRQFPPTGFRAFSFGARNTEVPVLGKCGAKPFSPHFSLPKSVFAGCTAVCGPLCRKQRRTAVLASPGLFSARYEHGRQNHKKTPALGATSHFAKFTVGHPAVQARFSFFPWVARAVVYAARPACGEVRISVAGNLAFTVDRDNHKTKMFRQSAYNTAAKRRAMPKHFKDAAWIHHFRHEQHVLAEHPCPTPWCPNTITPFQYECAHDYPVSKGGRYVAPSHRFAVMPLRT